MKKMIVFVLAGILSASLAAAATTTPAKKSSPKAVGPLAVINGEKLTVEELKEGFVKRHGGHTKFLGGQQELKKFINIIVDQRLLIQEAYNLGIDQNPDIRKAVDVYAEQKSIEYLLKSEIEDKSKPTEEEIHDTWAANTRQLYAVQEIVVESSEQAAELRPMLLRGGDFDVLARTCSIADSRMHGGRLGTIGWGTKEPGWEAVVFPLSPGDISQPFKTKDGWNVVQLLDRIEISQPEYKSVRSNLEGVLMLRKLDERRKALSDELWSQYHVVIAPIDHGAASLTTLKAAAPETAVASWDGGSLMLKEFPADGELRMMGSLQASRAKQFFDEQLRTAVNESLVHLAIKDRQIATTAPEVGDTVRRYQEDMMEAVLYAEHVLKGVTVTDDEVKAYFESHKAELTTPEKRHVAHLVVPTEEAAKTILTKMADGEEWSQLVKKNSTDTASVNDAGDLGWVTKNDTPREFVSVLALNEGQVSQPVHSKFGWHLIKVLAITPPKPMTFDEAKADIQKTVLEQKKREKRAYWVKKLREAATITISDAAIREYVNQNPFEEAKATPQSH